jgi:hypothetical protein
MPVAAMRSGRFSLQAERAAQSHIRTVAREWEPPSGNVGESDRFWRPVRPLVYPLLGPGYRRRCPLLWAHAATRSISRRAASSLKKLPRTISQASGEDRATTFHWPWCTIDISDACARLTSRPSSVAYHTSIARGVYRPRRCLEAETTLAGRVGLLAVQEDREHQGDPAAKHEVDKPDAQRVDLSVQVAA